MLWNNVFVKTSLGLKTSCLESELHKYDLHRMEIMSRKGLSVACWDEHRTLYSIQHIDEDTILWKTNISKCRYYFLYGIMHAWSWLTIHFHNLIKISELLQHTGNEATMKNRLKQLSVCTATMGDTFSFFNFYFTFTVTYFVFQYFLFWTSFQFFLLFFTYFLLSLTFFLFTIYFFLLSFLVSSTFFLLSFGLSRLFLLWSSIGNAVLSFITRETKRKFSDFPFLSFGKG